MKQIDVPLSDAMFAALQQAAEERHEPVVALAQQAIDAWLGQQKEHKEQLRAEIRAYAEEMAGSEEDLDEALEQASLEMWYEM